LREALVKAIRVFLTHILLPTLLFTTLYFFFLHLLEYVRAPGDFAVVWLASVIVLALALALYMALTND